MTPRDDHNAAALPDLLTLLEAHLDLHGRIVSKAHWQSPCDPPPPGWVPPEPEPDCDGACPRCSDFESRRCHLREERWANEWARLRSRYPELKELEELRQQLNREQPHWGSALYWVFMQPWDAWNPAKRAEWCREAIAWLCEHIDWWLPVYVPEGMPAQEPDRKAAKRRWVADMLRRGHTVRHIVREIGCSDRLVKEVSDELQTRAKEGG